MSTGELIKHYGVTEKMLPPWLKRGSGGRGGGGSIGSDAVETYEATEPFNKGCALHMRNDGKVEIASNIATDNKPATHIALEDATTGRMIKIGQAGRIVIGAMDADSDVWLTTTTAGLNITTTVEEIAEGVYVQKVGRTDAANGLWIDIEEPEYL